MARKSPAYWNKFWLTTCAYDANHKGSWHQEVKARLDALARHLGLPKGTYEVRSNMGGIAVSGEVTLHGENVYVQVSQLLLGGPRLEILYRTCNGRKDYSGGINHFAHISMMEDTAALAGTIKASLSQ